MSKRSAGQQGAPLEVAAVRTCPQALQWCLLLVMELNGSWHFIHRVTSFSRMGVGARFPNSTQL